MIPALAGLLAACGTGASDAQGPVAIRVWATDVTGSGGILVVQTSWDDGLNPELPEPEVDGLVFTPESTTPEHVGARTVLTRRWRFTGKKGSYQVPPLEVPVPDAEPVASLPIWVDLGVEVSNFEGMADIEDPSRIWTIPWGWICGIGTGGVLVLAGLAFGVSRMARPRERVAVVIPPDIRTLRAWEAVRADSTLSDDDKAKELSRLFREYAEEVLAFPAASWTTSEILERLQGMADIEDPSRIWTIPWGWICGIGTGGVLVLAGLAFGVSRMARPRERVVVVVPPDIRTLRAWEAVRADSSLSDDDKAKELSRLFREYAEEVLAFPAASWTTSEILERLQGMVHLPTGNVPRAKKLLMATDLVKFAEVSPETDFFDELDADLRAFVGSTRPAVWSAEPPPVDGIPGVPRG